VAGRGITVEHVPARDGRPPLELRRSARRRKTATAYPRGGVIVLQLPAGLPRDEERRIVGGLVDKVTGRARAHQIGGDEELTRRARTLADRYVDGVRPRLVRWSGRMQRRYGSCSTADGDIRISRELASYPDYVLDSVLVHELTHLVVADHSPAFWEIAGRYPQMERARGFLEGVRFVPAELDGGG
jgi:hypothetical protein